MATFAESAPRRARCLGRAATDPAGPAGAPRVQAHRVSLRPHPSRPVGGHPPSTRPARLRQAEPVASAGTTSSRRPSRCPRIPRRACLSPGGSCAVGPSPRLDWLDAARDGGGGPARSGLRARRSARRGGGGGRARRSGPPGRAASDPPPPCRSARARSRGPRARLPPVLTRPCAGPAPDATPRATTAEMFGDEPSECSATSRQPALTSSAATVAGADCWLRMPAAFTAAPAPRSNADTSIAMWKASVDASRDASISCAALAGSD